MIDMEIRTEVWINSHFKKSFRKNPRQFLQLTRRSWCCVNTSVMQTTSFRQLSPHFRLSVSLAHLKWAFVDFICRFHSSSWSSGNRNSASCTHSLRSWGSKATPGPQRATTDEFNQQINSQPCLLTTLDASNKLKEPRWKNIYASNTATNGSNNQPLV